MLNLKEIIPKLKLVIFDVDGVFTDGSVYVNKVGEEMMRFMCEWASSSVNC